MVRRPPISLSEHGLAVARHRVRASRDERRAWRRQITALREQVARLAGLPRDPITVLVSHPMVRRLRAHRDADRRERLMAGLTRNSQLLLRRTDRLLDRYRGAFRARDTS